MFDLEKDLMVFGVDLGSLTLSLGLDLDSISDSPGPGLVWNMTMVVLTTASAIHDI